MATTEGEVCSSCRRRAAKCACGCVYPPLSLCEHCLDSHTCAPAETHCDVCGGNDAETEACQGCAKRTCGQCFAGHIEECGRRNQEGESLSAVVSMLYSGLEDIRSAKEHSENLFRMIIREVYREKNRILKQLTEEIETIERCISEYNELQPGNLYIDTVRKSIGETVSYSDLGEKIRLFSYSANTEDLLMMLKTVFTFNVNHSLFAVETAAKAEITVNVLPFFGIKRKFFVIPDGFEIECENEMSLLQFTTCTVWTYASNECVLLTGEDRMKTAYMLDINTFQSFKTPPTAFAHPHAGIIAKDSFVYLFGGVWRDIPQRYCEVYDLKSNQWTILQSMQSARYQFQPCLYGEDVYLLGGKFTSNGESFGVRTREFKMLMLDMRFMGVGDGVSILCPLMI